MNFVISESAFVASVLFLQASTLSTETQGRHDRRTADTQACGYATVQPFLRAYSAAQPDHFYTTDMGEMLNALVQGGYTPEGDAAAVLPSQAPNTVPLYRAWNPGFSDHFYTTSSSELSNALQVDGYGYEGIAAYIYPSALCDTIPLYRMFNGQIGDHFYTTNGTERDSAIANDGYYYEGVAAYVFPANFGDAVRGGINAALNLTLVQ